MYVRIHTAVRKQSFYWQIKTLQLSQGPLLQWLDSPKPARPHGDSIRGPQISEPKPYPLRYGNGLQLMSVLRNRLINVSIRSMFYSYFLYRKFPLLIALPLLDICCNF